MTTILVDHTVPVTKRIEAAKKSLPYRLNLHEMAIQVHDDSPDGVPLCKEEYFFRLFEFPEGTSRKMAVYRMKRRGYSPADPSHMLAFAEQAFKGRNHFGEFHSYVVGLGGEVGTVLGAQFGGLNFGMCYFFQHLPQNKWTHDGGRNTRFLGIRLCRKVPRGD